MLKWFVYRYMPGRYQYTYRTNLWLWRMVLLTALLALIVGVSQLAAGSDDGLRLTVRLSSVIASAVMALGGLVFGLLIDEASRDALRERLAPYHHLIFAALFGGLFALGGTISFDPLHVFVILLAFPTALLAYFTLFETDDNPTRIRWMLWIFGILAVVVLVVRIYGLSYWPLPHTDEPWIMSYFDNRIAQNGLEKSFYYGRSTDVYFAFYPMSYWVELLGNNLWVARLYNVVLYPIIIALITALAYFMYGRWTAVLTAIIAFSSFTLHMTTMLRHDASFILLVAAALLLYVRATQLEKSAWHFGVGLIIGLSWYTHYHAVLVGPMIGMAFYLIFLLRREKKLNLTWRAFAYYVIGGLLGAAIVFITSKLPYWEILSQVREPRTPESIIEYLQTAWFYARLGWLDPIERMFIVFSLAGVLYKPKEFDVSLGVFVLLFIAALGLFGDTLVAYYTTHMAIALILLHSRLFIKLWDHLPKSQLAALVTAMLVFAPALGATTPFFALFGGYPVLRSTPPVVQWLEENIPTGAVIISYDWHYPFLAPDYTMYTSFSWVSATSNIREDYTGESAFWDAIAFDVFVYDPNAAGAFIVEPFATSDYFEERGYQRIILPPENLPFVPMPPDPFTIPGLEEDVVIHVRESLLD